MTMERKKELRKALISIEMFAIGASLSFGACSCAVKSAEKEKLSNTKTYYVAPITMINENGETTYASPSGWILAYDENGKPYCYQTINTNDTEIKTLKKSK